MTEESKMEKQQAAVDIGEDSKADARASPKPKKAPKPGYAQIAEDMNMCVPCCDWWMSYPDGYSFMLEMNTRRAAEFPNSIALCWDCGTRL